MRHGRATTTIALLATLAAATAAPAAYADSGLSAGADSSSAAATESSKPTQDTSAPAAAPATESSAPATVSAPQTEAAAPVTEAPATQSPVAMPATPEAPVEPQELGVIDRPAAPADAPADQPRPGGGTQLPFTGPGDVLLAVLLALLAGSGGILLLAGAAGRDEIDSLNRRSLASPSGFRLAYRELLKQQVDG